MAQDPRVIGYINLHVKDFAPCVAFYRDVVGLPLVFSDESFNYASFSAGGVSFAVAGDPNAVRNGEDRLSGIGICVKDVDAAYEELKAKGVRFTMTPSKQPWGGYMAMFADPDGNVLYLDRMPA
jgi:predicted enzyme related to lactoylglutathione lyase